MDYSLRGSCVLGILQARKLSGSSHRQGIFATQGLNPGLLHCRRVFYRLNHQGSLGIPAWVAYPFSRGYARTRNPTGVSYIVG